MYIRIVENQILNTKLVPGRIEFELSLNLKQGSNAAAKASRSSWWRMSKWPVASSAPAGCRISVLYNTRNSPAASGACPMRLKPLKPRIEAELSFAQKCRINLKTKVECDRQALVVTWWRLVEELVLGDWL